MTEDLKIKNAIMESLGKMPDAPENQAEDIFSKIQKEKTPSIWPWALAASIAAIAFFGLFWPSSPSSSNGEVAEFVVESLSTTYEAEPDTGLYEPWMVIAGIDEGSM